MTKKEKKQLYILISKMAFAIRSISGYNTSFIQNYEHELDWLETQIYLMNDRIKPLKIKRKRK